MGRAQGQGDLFGKPQTAAEFRQLLPLPADPAGRREREKGGAFLSPPSS